MPNGKAWESNAMIVLRSELLTVALSPYGARLTGLWHKDFPQSLVLGAPSGSDFTSDLMYFGALIGPIANRVSGGCIRIADTTWKMETNEPPNCLHSGSNGLHALNWTIADQSECHATFQIVLDHGHGGLPGNRTFIATYAVEDAKLLLDIHATSDQTTPINIAHHPYWNLSQEVSVGQHTLKTAADTYLPVDNATCPTGDIASVSGTAYDFTQPRMVPTDTTLDANLCLSNIRRATPHFAARLSAKDGPTLAIATTEPGLQIYNGTGLRPSNTKLHSGQKLGCGAGIALEPQGWPDAQLHPHFPSILCTVGTRYRQSTVYSFA